MIIRSVKWAVRLIAILLSLSIVAVAGFRLAAWHRESAARADIAPAGGRLITTKSGAVFIQEAGPAVGIPVLLFHGTAAWSELWRRTSNVLSAAGFRVIALDLPPFGFSDRPGTYTRADQAARVNDLLDQLKIEKAIVVGHSFGAGAATELVMRFPERARSLVLVDAALGLTAPQTDAPVWLRPKWIREIIVSLSITNPLATKSLLESLIAKKERALPEYTEILQRPTVLRNSTPDIADWVFYFMGADRDALSADRNSYARVKVRTAILWGEKDTVTPLDQATDLQALMPNASLTLLPDLGHIPQIEDPDIFNHALLRILKTL